MPGAYTWQITCEGAPPAATANAFATFLAKSGGTGGGGSSGGGGGGGGVDPLVLALLGMSTLAQRRMKAALRSQRGARS